MTTYNLRLHPHQGGILIDEYINAMSLDGILGEEERLVSDGGSWAGLIRGGLYNERYAREFALTPDEIAFIRRMAGAILFKSGEGLVTVRYYESPEALKKAWDELMERRGNNAGF